MSSSNEDDGPKIVWTFPLIRVLSRRRLITSIASRVAEGNVVERISVDDDGEEEQEQSFSQSESDNRLTDIESDISELTQSSETAFAQAEGVNEISIQDDVFIPTRTQIDVGETVVWTNEDDEPHTVMAIEGATFTSEQIEAGEEFEHTFDEEGVIIYIDSIVGGDRMCGAVMVGDAELDQELPCEREQEFVPFEEEDNELDGVTTEVRSMSDAAEEKQDIKEDAV